jgi:hypothetical protein
MITLEAFHVSFEFADCIIRPTNTIGFYFAVYNFVNGLTPLRIQTPVIVNWARPLISSLSIL